MDVGLIGGFGGDHDRGQEPGWVAKGCQVWGSCREMLMRVG